MRFPRLTRLISGAFIGLSVAAPGFAQGLAGPYLAARQADRSRDFAAAVEYGIRAIARDPKDTGLMETLLVAEIGLGAFDQAVPIARRLHALEDGNKIAGLVLLAASIKAEDWPGVEAALQDKVSIGGSLDDLIGGWALFGQGDREAAFKVFKKLGKAGETGQIALYNLAIAHALAGGFKAAAEILSGQAGGEVQLDRKGIIAYAQILSQLERNPAAVELIDKAFPGGGDAEIAALRADLAAGKPIAFSVVSGPRQALSDVFGAIAQALAREMQPEVVLLYSRTSAYLNPRNYEAVLLSATLLELLERYDLAVATYAQVPRDSRLYRTASLSRAEALRRWGKGDEAIAVLEKLAAEFPDAVNVYKTLGDTFRFQHQCDKAIAPYDHAIGLIETPQKAHWSLFFARGICHEQEDQWDAAEADLLKALELYPDQPSVLNYLGYSWVEQRRNLDQALDMIRRAVAARPEDGYITDSLGWVNYRLGNYREAVGEMERAVELMPVDPVLNDHLGDVYWAVGRKLEAEFQWRRALSFMTDDTDPDEFDAERVRRKLEVGLDKVLQEEGAPPLHPVNEGG